MNPELTFTNRSAGVNLNVGRAFFVLLLYYWALQYGSGVGNELLRGSFAYFLYVAPISVFAFSALALVASVKRLSSPAALMLIFGLTVGSVAVVRGDLQTLLSTALLCATLAVVFEFRLSPSATLLNRLFFASIVVNTVLFLTGATIYSVIPGFSTDGELTWRVSMFPHVATSAFFSLIIFFVNLVDKKSPFRTACLFLSSYFVLMSGLRSALMAGVVAGTYLILVRWGVLRSHAAKMLFLPISVSAFVALLFASQFLLLLIPDIGNDSLNAYLFRSESGLQSEEDAARAIFRTWIWTEHVRIAAQDPLFGVGTFDFGEFAGAEAYFGELSNGSESFLTALFARVGLPVLLFLAGLFAAVSRGVRSGQHLHMVVGILTFIAMISYGSFINPYDFVFLVMIGLISARPSALSK